MEVNAVTMVVTGIGLWTLALVVVLVLRAAGAGISPGTVPVCVAGIALGLIGLVWAVRRERRRGPEAAAAPTTEGRP